MVRHRIWLATLLWCVTMPVWAAAVPDNLVGESCTRSPPEDVEPEPGVPIEDALRCGGLPAGRVLVVRAGMSYPNPTAYQAGLTEALRHRRIQSELMGLLVCDAPRWLDPAVAGGGAEPTVIAVPCRQKNGGWPRLVLGHLNGGWLRVVEGAPAHLPGMIALLEVAPTTAPRERQIAALKTVYGATVPLVTARELERFREMVKQARAANQKGLHAEAEALLRDAIALQTRFLGENDFSVVQTVLDLALLVSNQGRVEEATRLLNRAGVLLDQSPRPEERARLDLYRGFDAANRGRFDQGLRYAQSAAQAWRQLLKGESASLENLADADPFNRTLERGELAFALNLLAQMAVRDGQLVLASVSAAEALQIFNTTEGLPPAWRADTLMVLGEISIAQRRLSAAETYLNASIAIRRQLFGEGPPVIRALFALGRAYQQEGLEASAILSFRDAMAMTRRLGPAAREILREDDLIPLAEAALSLGSRLNPVDRDAVYADVFSALGLLRAPLVARTISQTADRLSQDQPELAALLRKRQSAQRALDAARVDLAIEILAPSESRSAIVEGRLADSIERQRAEIATLTQRLQTEFPAYQQLMSPAVPSVPELQAVLRPNEGLLTFLFGRDKGFALLVRRDGVQLARVGESRDSLGAAVTALRRALVLEANMMSTFDVRVAHQLHEALLSGLVGAMRGLDHLVVVQTGPLASLPLGVLIASPPNGEDYSQHDWLGRHIALTSVPAVSAFHALRTAPPRAASGDFLGVGNPGLRGGRGQSGAQELMALCRDGGAVAPGVIQALPPLPDTAQELRRVEAVFSKAHRTRLLLGFEATEAGLMREQLNQYRVLYFASHAVLPGELKCAGEPALVLTPPEAAGSRNEDGLLEASEIAQLDLNADLVVLSACNTAGAGGKFGGDALSGLAEAFFHAGTRAVVASHWQVPSAATTSLMTSMFETLGPDIQVDPARALQQAQLRLMANQQTAHPFFWGAFVVVGDGSRTSRAPAANVKQASVSGAEK